MCVWNVDFARSKIANIKKTDLLNNFTRQLYTMTAMSDNLFIHDNFFVIGCALKYFEMKIINCWDWKHSWERSLMVSEEFVELCEK